MSAPAPLTPPNGGACPGIAQLSTPVTPALHNSVAPPGIPDHELLKCIGRGSYGEVWLARNVLGQFRAVKIVHRATFEDDRPFEREFEGIRRFEPISRSHPSQLNILHVGRGEGCFFYVMELADAGEPRVEGRTELRVDRRGAADSLSHRMGEGRGEGTPSQLSAQDPLNYVPRILKLDLKRRGRLPSAECVEIGLALTTALAHLHAHGLVHRDIKPSNIIFVGGVPKLADIGLVTDVDASRSFVGTEGFLPPEGPGTPQADLYSLGKVLYEMSTGRDRKDYPALPLDWDALDPAAQARLLELNEVLVKVCEADPRRRYQTAEELREDLALLKGGNSIRRQRAVESRRILARKVVFCLAAVAILAVGTWALSTKLVWRSPDNARPKVTEKNPPSPEVVRLCKLGFDVRAKGTKDSYTEAFDLLNRAVALDPGYVPAYLGLAGAYNEAADWLLPARQALPEVKRAATSALQIDPSSAEALQWLGVFKMSYEWDWVGAEADLKRAIQLGPKDAGPHFFYTLLLLTKGRLPEARVEQELALELAPDRLDVIGSMVRLYCVERRFDDALALALNGRREHTNNVGFRIWLAWIYQQKGMYPQAVDELCGARALEDGPDLMAILAHAYAVSGNKNKARELLNQLREHSSRANVPQYLFALIQVGLGDTEAALGCLQKAAVERSTSLSGLGFGLGVALDPHFDPLRSDPLFQQLLRDMRLR